MRKEFSLSTQVIAFLLVLLSFHTPLVSAQEDEEKGLIAYVGIDGNVWVVRSDGSERWQITFDAEPDTVGYIGLQWSPNGQNIAFIAEHVGVGRNVWMVKSDGSNLSQITFDEEPNNVREFQWSPDSQKIAFVTEHVLSNSRFRIYVMMLDGSDLESLVSPSSGEVIGLIKWSPDSLWLSFVMEKDIWKVNIDNGITQRLTNTPDIAEGAIDWSPDGQRLVYIAYEPWIFSSLKPYIYSIRADGSELLKLTSDKGTYLSPIWSPNGSKILFSWNFETEDGFFHIYIVQLNGQGITRLTNPLENFSGLDPIWSPDGSKIAFRRLDVSVCPLTGECEDNELWYMSSDGTGQTRLTGRLAIHKSQGGITHWSPDSQRIAYSALNATDDTYKIHLVTLSTGVDLVVADGHSPAWQPTIAEEPLEAQPWLDEKAELIDQLEDVNIPTSLFTVPAVSAFNEDAARELHNQIATKFEQDALSPEELEAFARLTLQERAISQLLPAYTTIAATISDTSVDSVETALSLIFILKPAWNKCKELIPFCGRLQQATDRLVWRLVNSSGRVLISTFTRVFGSAPEQRETFTRFSDLIVRATEDAFAQGKSLQELLLDNATEAAGTYLLVDWLYLRPTQQLLNDGVATADLSETGDERWPITGDTERASNLISSYTDLAAIEEQAALDRHRDFQEAADIVKFAEDLADAATLSPAALIAQTVSFWARVEHLLLVNLPETLLNVQNLRCIGYLSSRAAEVAFDADQPFESCRDRNESLQPNIGQITFVSYQPISALHPLQVQMGMETEQYWAAVQALRQTIETRDMVVIEQAVDQVIEAEAAMTRSLDAAQAILLEQETVDAEDLDFIEKSLTFTTRNLTLYLTVAETLLTQAAEEQSQTDIDEAAQAALRAVDAIEQSVELIDLTPTDKPILVIQDVGVAVTSDQQLQLNVEVSNVGAAEALDVKIGLLVEDEQVAASTMVGSLAAGQQAEAALSVVVPDTSVLAVQVWAQDVLMDTYLLSIPLFTTISATPTVGASDGASEAVESTDSEVETGDEVAGADISPQDIEWLPTSLTALGGLVLIIGSGIFLQRQRRTAAGHSPDAVSHACPHCSTLNPPYGRFCKNCGRPLE